MTRLSPDTRFSLLPRMGGPSYLQAVGAWLRRRLVRLEEDLLAPPEELDNSDEDVVQHQDHARSRPPAPPARPSVSASATASPVRARVRPGPASPPPPPRPRPPGPAYVSATGDSTSTPSKDRTPPDPGRLAPFQAFNSQVSCSGSATRLPSLRSLLSLRCPPLIPSSLPLCGRAPPRVPRTVAPHSLPITWTSVARPEPRGRVQRSAGRGAAATVREPRGPFSPSSAEGRGK